MNCSVAAPSIVYLFRKNKVFRNLLISHGSLLKVVLETVLMLAWMNSDRYRHMQMDRQPLLFSSLVTTGDQCWNALVHPSSGSPLHLSATASLAKWLRRSPREGKIRGSNPACDGIFPGRIIPVTSKFALQWLLCRAPGIIGSALGLVGPVSVYCDSVR